MLWGRLFFLLFFAFLGGVGGLIVGFGTRLPGQSTRDREDQEFREDPLPHHVPKYPGAVTLRFAMVHDVIHERYPKHGEAYYRERNRQVRESLAKKGTVRDEADFALLDDLGAGLDYLKQDDEAVLVLREKLRGQENLGLSGRELYTTYANLGTFLIHGNFPRARSGDVAAKQLMREGLRYIHKSIEVNPHAHFGREVWQAVVAEYLLTAIEKPGILLEFDMIGDDLLVDVDPSQGRSLKDATRYGFEGLNRSVAASLEGKSYPHGDPAQIRRDFTTRVGAEADWDKLVATPHKEPVPFDEPVLGIIGMWRLGGGANPYFALALGEIMLRVGQRYIAWTAYERAVLLAPRYWPDEEIQKKLVAHCRERQQIIEKQLSEADASQLRPRFEGELAFGQQFQREYQEYEEQRIRDGVSLDDDHFYDPFNASHEPIASAVGPEDKFLAERRGWMPFLNWSMASLGAGCMALLAACLARLFIPRRPPPAIEGDDGKG